MLPGAALCLYDPGTVDIVIRKWKITCKSFCALLCSKLVSMCLAGQHGLDLASAVWEISAYAFLIFLFPECVTGFSIV